MEDATYSRRSDWIDVGQLRRHKEVCFRSGNNHRKNRYGVEYIMYRGFNLEINHDEFKLYESLGREIHRKNKQSVETSIRSFLNPDGTLNASEIENNWFPQMHADVFLSHAHRDSELAIRFAGWLNNNFGLTAFIDSCVWGYAEDLLKAIDDTYCYNKTNKTYIYKMRNRSTSHVHMMLSVALSNMINNCECVIFINTPSSIPVQQHVQGTQTYSPWIYSEIAMTSLIQRRQPKDHRKITANLKEAMESFIVSYDAKLEHLSRIGKPLLEKWLKEWNSNIFEGDHALDVLYKLTR
jgi:hypothetical protein